MAEKRACAWTNSFHSPCPGLPTGLPALGKDTEDMLRPSQVTLPQAVQEVLRTGDPLVYSGLPGLKSLFTGNGETGSGKRHEPEKSLKAARLSMWQHLTAVGSADARLFPLSSRPHIFHHVHPLHPQQRHHARPFTRSRKESSSPTLMTGATQCSHIQQQLNLYLLNTNTNTHNAGRLKLFLMCYGHSHKGEFDSSLGWEACGRKPNWDFSIVNVYWVLTLWKELYINDVFNSHKSVDRIIIMSVLQTGKLSLGEFNVFRVILYQTSKPASLVSNYTPLTLKASADWRICQKNKGRDGQNI